MSLRLLLSPGSVIETEAKTIDSLGLSYLYSYDGKKPLIMAIRPSGLWNASEPGTVISDFRDLEENKSLIITNFQVHHQSGRMVNILAECSSKPTPFSELPSLMICFYVSHAVYNESGLPLQVQMVSIDFDEESGDKIILPKNKAKKVLVKASGEGNEILMSPLFSSKSSALAMQIGVYDQVCKGLGMVF